VELRSLSKFGIIAELPKYSCASGDLLHPWKVLHGRGKISYLTLLDSWKLPESYSLAAFQCCPHLIFCSGSLGCYYLT
jgi:hypothetical protein